MLSSFDPVFVVDRYGDGPRVASEAISEANSR